MFVFMFKNPLVPCLLVLLAAQLSREAAARPPWAGAGSEVFADSAQCDTDDELLDLCQRCAKLTKSRQAYPGCCSTDIQARRWCWDYVYFGKGIYDMYLFR